MSDGGDVPDGCYELDESQLLTVLGALEVAERVVGQGVASDDIVQIRDELLGQYNEHTH